MTNTEYWERGQYARENQVFGCQDSSAWDRAEAYAGGRHIATYVNNTTYFDHRDWLGNERVNSTLSAGIHNSCANFPYGEMSCTSSISPLHFTGKERDTESGNDLMGARYYSSSMGRFLSPDPSQGYFADPTNPQSLNFYSYALNNPLQFADPTGLFYCQWSVDANGNEDRDDRPEDGGASQQECSDQGGTWITEPGDPETIANGTGSAIIPNPTTDVNVNGGSDDDSGTDVTFTTEAFIDYSQLSLFPVKACTCFNLAAFSYALDTNATYNDRTGKSKPANQSIGLCGRYFGWAANAGGAKVGSHNGGDYGPPLTKAGWNTVSQQGYTAQEGDAAIFSPNDTHSSGHSTGYDGSQWVSDFTQRQMNPYRDPGSAGTLTIYRPGCTCP